jgi:UPF0755 protein
LKKLVALVVALLVLGVAGWRGYGWWNQVVNQPVASSSQPVLVHVSQGESADAIAAQLYGRGLIRNQQAFTLYIRSTGASGRFQAGDFPLNRNMSMAEIVTQMTSGVPAQLTLTLREGDTLQQMAQAIQGAGLGAARDYLAAARPSAWLAQYDFLQGLPATAPANLEGFLFPDTYRLSRSEGPQGLVKRQLERFRQVVTPALRAQMTEAVAGRPAETLWNVLVLASIVEREVNKDADRPVVCGVFYNRLAAGITLGADATVLYGLGQTAGQLTEAQLTDAGNAYNTRVHHGLPPGPISNPGLASIQGCVTPQPSPYYYYFVDKGGTTRYAKTLAEFNQQQAQYGVG